MVLAEDAAIREELAEDVTVQAVFFRCLCDLWGLPQPVPLPVQAPSDLPGQDPLSLPHDGLEESRVLVLPWDGDGPGDHLDASPDPQVHPSDLGPVVRPEP